MTFARDAGQRIAFMDDGVIVESGAPGELLSRPAHERTRAFLSRLLAQGT
jgi:polar amino acid transport system ATP-binding protein